MNETLPSFNLIDDPWIPVQDHDGAARLVSVKELYADAPALRSIGGDIPTQAFAITRLLLAITRRAVDWGSDPVRRWSEIVNGGRFPTSDVDAYLDGVRQRFDLLHPTQPFYQVADLATAKGEFKPVALLLADVPTGEKYFTTRAGRGTETLGLAEAARWLLHCQAFDISGIKSADSRDPRGRSGKGYPIGVSWAGQLGGMVFEGRSVFETLMLNTVVKDPDGRSPQADDLPVWEREHPTYRERELLVPSGPVDLLTWQSRRVRLIADGSAMISKVFVANGDPLDSHNRFSVEFMTGWRFSAPQSKKFGEDRYLPRQWDSERSLWRGVEGLLADVPDETGGRLRTRASGAAHWLERVIGEDLIAPDTPIRVHAYGLSYISQASVVEASFDDSLLMRVALLGRYSEARADANRAVQCATAAVQALGVLAQRLAQAAGGSGEGERQNAEAAAYFALDSPYRDWLFALSDEPADDVDAGVNWEKTVRGIVDEAGRRLVEDAGELAWRGRRNNGRWPHLKSDRLDSATAESIFRRSLRKALPRAYDGHSDSTKVGETQ